MSSDGAQWEVAEDADVNAAFIITVDQHVMFKALGFQHLGIESA